MEPNSDNILLQQQEAGEHFKYYIEYFDDLLNLKFK